MTKVKNSGKQEELSDANKKILKNLEDRCVLLGKARENELELEAGAAVVLQALDPDSRVTSENSADENSKIEIQHKPEDVLEAVEYRLAITDLFVEKAQFHLEDRARRYRRIGYTLYGLAITIVAIGAIIACYRMLDHDKQVKNEPQPIKVESTLSTVPNRPVVIVLNEQAKSNQWSASQVPIVSPDSKLPINYQPVSTEARSSQKTWVELLFNFIISFTAYGFIVLTAVILARGARACLDQRERLLAKRHSLRQGRLYIHLTGGRVSVGDMERAFNWNHEQHNAFTNMSTDAKAPWGNVVEEIIKIIPELVKTGVAAAEKKAGPSSPTRGANL